MAYDKSLDKELFNESVEFEITKLAVSIFSYNEGTPKLQLSRENRNQNTGEWQWSKLGRLTKEEVEKLLPLVNKAMEQM